MRNNIPMAKALWRDCETDDERIWFLQCGRAVETGIIAATILHDIANAFIFRNGVMKERIKTCEIMEGVDDGMSGM